MTKKGKLFKLTQEYIFLTPEIYHSDFVKKNSIGMVLKKDKITNMIFIFTNGKILCDTPFSWQKLIEEKSLIFLD